MKLKRSTFHNSVYCFDRFISLVKFIEVHRMKLVAGTILFFVSKKEEYQPIGMSMLVHLLDQEYPARFIMSVEIKILKVL